ncbi:hypothetical protein Y032_0025g1291 [Ancylostoma ceylanicum]|uniref:HTH psq-type domain-containing protein n=1 Tax=Ancylostoma ceylanicum TaxID=53326 RepID=A0A016UWA1_9BILA|nr:hypothetical protein Y032_0025g1291 [Ancylostoma ceylanicum]
MRPSQSFSCGVVCFYYSQLMVFHVFEATVPPPPRPNNKAIRGYYTRRVLSDAVKQVIFGAMTVTEAAQHFKIPRTTIQKHVSKAREQHNLKEHYIRRMEAVRRGLAGRMPEDDVQHRLSEQRTAYLMSYGLDAWPTDSNEESAPTHWRQQPVRLDPSPPRLPDTAQCSLEDDMIVAEQCEVMSEEVSNAKPVLLRREPDNEGMPLLSSSGSSTQQSCGRSGISVNPVTRVVLRHEGSDNVVKEVLISRPSLVPRQNLLVKDDRSPPPQLQHN